MMPKILCSSVVVLLAITFVAIDSHHHHHKKPGHGFPITNRPNNSNSNGFSFIGGPCNRGAQYNTNTTQGGTCYCFFNFGYFCVTPLPTATTTAASNNTTTTAASRNTTTTTTAASSNTTTTTTAASSNTTTTPAAG